MPELIRAISAYIQQRNHHPRPFVWTASTASIRRNDEKTMKNVATARDDSRKSLILRAYWPVAKPWDSAECQKP